MEIELNGLQRFRVYDFILGWKPGSRTAAKVAKSLIEKVLPEKTRLSCQISPTTYDPRKLAALPVTPTEISEAEAEALRSSLEQAMPGITVADFDWFDALLESVMEKD